MTRTIAVIGGGIASVMIALVLAQLKDGRGQHLFKVCIFEKRPGLLEGTSQWLSRQHMGLEYAKDQQTALQCLWGTVLLLQLLPRETFSVIQGADYVTKQSVEKKSVIPEELHNTAENNRSHYARWLSTGKLTQVQQLLGHPEMIFRQLAPASLQAPFAAGVSANELGFNSIL